MSLDDDLTDISKPDPKVRLIAIIPVVIIVMLKALLQALLQALLCGAPEIANNVLR